ncbi:adenosylcobinamide-phosphate synthase CbiB [Methanococcus maripaludis]|uniref:Probable cobalamin biosynthesis protein CobD n=1 Tax=Methanococcus maripaludis TaxID=39152 RepID=A0A7J9NQ33_METMI|nr:adenosylcobinamide-phosphate synthase CbiB [Methanococcus maripaludis]MBA2846838.1 adenosylcobinamide-phosphate synthase [Methanococcus maripaludis]MBM7408983.1 adenosylcobinamide-phosphate synthase [Methanococcus maripaludis]MBP2218831.1 adenosylcobinamide-phosphate synthase [Methanococcus maripaludis]
MINPIYLILADFFDRYIGEPPEKVHPVVFIGKLISFFENVFKSTNSVNKNRDLLFGFLNVVLVLAIVFFMAFEIEQAINSISNSYIRISLYSIILSFSIGHKSLIEFSKSPIKFIVNNDLESAKKSVQCIVSRNTSELDKKHILSASIESASENITDSIIAPLIYAAIFGLPGAFLYRAVNTFDAMIGYKSEKYLYYGKTAAYLDDILNFIPSRIAGMLLIISAPFYGGNIKSAILGYFNEGSKTPSPNSGYTMATLANSLSMELEKIGYYKLGKGEITVEKALNSLKAVDYSVLLFLIIYMILFM